LCKTPQPGESVFDPPQTGRSAVVWDFDVCFSDGLAAGGQPGDEPADVFAKSSAGLSRTGKPAACRHTEPTAGPHRREAHPGEPARLGAAAHSPQEILSLPDFALLSDRHRRNPEAAAGVAVDRAMLGA